MLGLQNKLEEIDSSEIKFILSGERFPIDTVGSYNIDRAKSILAKVPRKSRPANVHKWRAIAKHMESQHLVAPPKSNIDYLIPAIIATVDKTAAHYMLIDGWHRLEKAITEGRETIQAFYLTEAESIEVFDISWVDRNPTCSFA
jgi:beta-N-acetylglucosaminidase